MWLERLVDATRQRIDAGYYRTRPDRDLEPLGSLRQAVEAAPAALVAEVKPGRPGEAVRDVDVAQRARAYAQGGACGVSVLTDPDHFGGSLENLERARPAGVPLLMKDFVLGEAQLDAARAWGASCVLAIARLHVDGDAELELAELVEAAHDRGLEVLAEAVTGEELDLSIASGADLLGINVRDLDSLELDPERPGRLLATRDVATPVLHLSGVSTPAHVQAALASGCAGVLVGSHLMAQSDPESACRTLLEAVA